MAKHAEVHLFFVPLGPRDGLSLSPPGGNIRLFPVTAPASPLDRLVRHSCFFLETKFLADAVRRAGHRYDIIYAHDLPSSYPALLLAREQGALIIYDVHDLYVETINQFFPATAPPLKRLLHAVARWVMRTTGALWERAFIQRAALVVTPTASYLRYLDERYGSKGGMVLPNYPELREVEATRSIYERCAIPAGHAIALYHGTLNRGRYLEMLVESAEFLEEGNTLVLIGNGHLENDLKKVVHDKNLRNVRFLDHVPYDELFGLASGASLGVILIEHINLSKKYALANKLTEYMASGIAVLASDSPENRRILDDVDAGFIGTFTSPDQLGRHLNELLSDREGLAEKGRAGRRAFVERFNWNVHEPAFAAAFRHLLGVA